MMTLLLLHDRHVSGSKVMMDTEEITTMTIDIQRILPVATECVPILSTLDGVERAFAVGLISWAMYADNSEQFLSLAKEFIPQIAQKVKEVDSNDAG